MLRPLAVAAFTATALALPAAVPAATAADDAPRRLEGTLPNGTAWVADVPAGWNGTLLLYSHGYRPNPPVTTNPAANAPNAATAEALLARGYALAGSSYSRLGWTLDTAAEDQLATLAAVTRQLEKRPQRTLAVGTSMGGLVTGQLAEHAGEVIDAAMPTCGLLHGGVDLLNYQLDGGHAIAQLLAAPGQAVQLTGYADRGEAEAATAALTEAVQAAQASPQGRARVALAAAFYHLPTWQEGQPQPADDDHVGQQEAQARQFPQALAFTWPARFDIESNAGGNPSWNAGVDYAQTFRESDQRKQVEALYREAGLDLGADLARLTSTADVQPDPAALEWMRSTSTLSGEIDMPVLTMHTTDDVLAPVEVEQEYREDVVDAGRHGDLRSVFVARPGHCTFTPAEIVAGVQAVEQRLDLGRWGRLGWPGFLDRRAESLGLGDADFVVGYRPAAFLGDRDDQGPAEDRPARDR